MDEGSTSSRGGRKQENTAHKYSYKPLPPEVLKNTRLLGSNYDEYVITTELDSLLSESLSRVLGIHKAYEIIDNIRRLTGMSLGEVLVNNPSDFITAFEHVIRSPPERILHDVFRVLSGMVGINEEPPNIFDTGEFARFIEKIIKVIAETKAKYFTRIINNSFNSR